MTVLPRRLSPAVISGGTYRADTLCHKHRENFPKGDVVSGNIIVEINYQRIITNTLTDAGVAEIIIPETNFSYIDGIDVREEKLVGECFSKEHLFPSPEYALGVVLALINLQPTLADPGYLIGRNRFYFWHSHKEKQPGEMDVIAADASKWYGIDGWLIAGGHACSYNNINLTSRFFSAESCQ